MIFLSAFVSGLLFGLGLIISEMVNPARVQGFLDWFGSWDPTLAFVMAGALSVTTPAMLILKKRRQPLFADKFEWPTRKDIDSKLVLGSAMFGIGWGITGFCPGPALVGSSSLQPGVFLFLACMLIGMGLHSFVTRSNA
jgi:hypothetical protein